MYDEFDKMELEDLSDTGKKIKNVKWFIEVNNLKFSYNNSSSVLNWIDFSIKPWEKVAFVWTTWAWKSTIVNLLLRLWERDSGNISLDWNDISDINKKSLRRAIWLVSQDSSLFNMSIKENLLFANSKATKKQISEALKNAKADFVFDLENWIDTIIWERWLKLSGWEKQRLSIARLFLKNPQILILDEATSALDNKTEKLIQVALQKLMKNRTSIIVAHRLSTIKWADKIFVLEKWKIVEVGNYDELIKLWWYFASLASTDHLIIN